MKYLLFVLGLFLALSGVSHADVLRDMGLTVAGRTVYGPSLIRADNKCHLFFGGWQSQEDIGTAVLPNGKTIGNDGIYHAVSDSCSAFFGQPEKLRSPDGTKDFLGWLNDLHVSDAVYGITGINDPKVTRHWNTVAQAWQWTMFFDGILDGDVFKNRIFMAVSLDGEHWYYPAMLDVREPGGALADVSQPAPLINPDYKTGVFWDVYVREDISTTTLNRVGIGGDEQVHAPLQAVYTPTGQWAPDDTLVPAETGNWSAMPVRLGNSCYVYFNQYIKAKHSQMSLTDIRRIKALDSDCKAFPVQPVDEGVVENSLSGEICGVITPYVLEDTDFPNGLIYDLYFGIIPMPTQAELRANGGICDYTQIPAIGRFDLQRTGP